MKQATLNLDLNAKITRKQETTKGQVFYHHIFHITLTSQSDSLRYTNMIMKDLTLLNFHYKKPPM